MKKVTFILPEMLFHSRRDKSQALDMSNFLAQVMPKISAWPLLESAHIERLKFAGMEMNQHFRQNIGHSQSGNESTTKVR